MSYLTQGVITDFLQHLSLYKISETTSWLCNMELESI